MCRLKYMHKVSSIVSFVICAVDMYVLCVLQNRGSVHVSGAGDWQVCA